MITKTFLDTNVLVYAYDNRYPAKQRLACSLLDQLVSSEQAVISTQVLAEFCVATTKKISNPLSLAEAMHCIDRYTQCMDVLPVTGAIVREAVRISQAYQISYWDAQIWATAHLNQIMLIVSEDTPSSCIVEGIRYHNPFKDL